MKIAMIGQKGIPATYGGVERHVEELAARLAAKGHHVTAYCRRHYTPPGKTEHRGVRLKRLPSVNTRHLDAISHTACALLAAALEHFDIIHFHAIGPSLLSFFPRLLPFRCRAVVATVHSQDYRRRKWGAFARWCLRCGEAAALRFPHRTIVVSKQLRHYFEQRGRSVVYIPNGVESPAPRPLDKLKRFDVETNRFILWLGRFVPEKRVGDLVAAFGQIHGEWKLLLGGETDEDDAFLRHIRSLAKDDPRVILAGGLYGDQKAEALANAALVVLPSELEGFPITLLEAMRYGRAVLVSDIPEHLEAVQPRLNGFSFPLGDIAALAEKMQWMLTHPDEAAAAALKAAETAAQYDWDPIADQTERVYKEALG